MSVATASSPNYDVPRPSADSTLRLESWYHGTVTRIRSESLVHAPGDFLVRDSISSKGDFVLTVFWKGRAIHFQINKTRSTNSSTGFFFQFEDEQFESVSDLISFYQSHRQVITLASGCIISNPVPKSTPVTDSQPYKEIEENYVKMFFPNNARHGIDRCLSQQVLLNQACKFLNRASSTSSVDKPASRSPASPKQHLALSALLNRPLPIPERSPVSDDNSEYCEMDYDSMESPKTPSPNRGDKDVLDASTSSLFRRAEHTSLTSLNSIKNSPLDENPISQSCLDVSKRSSKLHWRLPRTDSAPTLPARKPSLPVRDSGCVPDSSDYDQPRPSPQQTDTRTQIDAVKYRSPLIDSGNRPQSKELVDMFRTLLLKHTPEESASLITAEDCRLLRLIASNEVRGDVRRHNGMAVLLLPQGAPMRTDLIERGRSLQFLCVISILNGSRLERARMLSVWIRLASQLIAHFGNLFSFITVMSALRSEAIQSVAALWTDLEADDNDRYHSELIPSFDRLVHGESTEETGPVVIPCIQPLLDLLSNSPSSTFLDMTSLSSQIESLWMWLGMGRDWALNSQRFQRVAVALFPQAVPSEEANFLGVEFSLRFLFGARGCASDVKLRYQKLMEVVDALADRARLQD